MHADFGMYVKSRNSVNDVNPEDGSTSAWFDHETGMKY